MMSDYFNRKNHTKSSALHSSVLFRMILKINESRTSDEIQIMLRYLAILFGIYNLYCTATSCIFDEQRLGRLYSKNIHHIHLYYTDSVFCTSNRVS